MQRVLTLLAVLGVVVVLGGLQPVAAFADDSAGAPASGLVATSRAGLTSLLPSESRPADWGTGCGCGTSGSSWPSTSYSGGFWPGMSWGNPFWPWWAGMPLWQISALTGGTWPFGGFGFGYGGMMMPPPPMSPMSGVPGPMGGMSGSMGNMSGSMGNMDGSSGP